MGRTSIQVSDEFADRVYNESGRGESYQQTLERLLGWAEHDHDERGGRTDLRTEAPPQAAVADVQLPSSLPGHVDESAARRAISATLDAVSDHPQSFIEIAETVGRDHDLGYQVTQVETRDGAWWSRIVKPGIKQNGAEHTPGQGWRVEQ